MTELLTVISIVFIIAGPFLLLANYLRLPTAPALIVAGLAAGGFIDPQLKLEMARLGIALLVFTFAVRIQTTDLQTAIGDSEVVALAQLAIVGPVGFGAGLLLGLGPGQAIFLGIATAISSSIAGSTLFLPGTLELVHDRLSESIHSIQDFTALILLLIVSGGAFALDPIANQFGYGVMLLLLAIAINRYLYDLLVRFSGGVDESLLIGTIALLLLFLGAAEFVGLSIVVGAFAAGVAVPHEGVEYSGVLNGLEPINNFFAGIFFITVGALVTLPTWEVIVTTLVLVGVVGIIKPAVTIALLIYKGYERRTATLTGFNLDQIGEFALIIAIEGLFLGLLASSVFDAIILAAAITLLTSSFTRQYDEEIYHLLANNGLLGRHGRTVERWSNVPEDLTDHIVIVGYGRHGRRLVETCEEHDRSYVVIESNPALIDDLQENCRAHVFGDVVEPKTLEKARLTEADLVISTADSRPVNEHVVSYSNRVDVIVRSKDRASARELLDSGAFYVSVSDLLAADRLEERFEGLIEGNYDREMLRQEALDSIDEYSGAPYRAADERVSV
ncbi:Kef-type K+ transport system, membrane component [Halalkaliarchaeum desulfuricum]|uniref:Kef-type K+ transport system, membrane component n=1 Tax=Halalkaliarchaeum desulfuricum TaxID=2055893 RepID=A0A343TFP2_9EURY|nr:cation:proton antiporter [Halalkaliarchaeum desulfuricum]AUX07914.1 Kef-type K+ transport system, membrane component [Halalkaliarchaeum desulfuricum]